MNQALKVIVVILAFVGIFLAGAVTGGVVMTIVSKAHLQQLQHEHQLEQAQHQLEQQERQMEKQQFTQLVGVLRQQLQQQQQQLQQRPPARDGQTGQRRLPAPEQFGPQLMQRFTNQIRPPLTPEERATIRPLVNQTAEDLRRLRRDTTNKTEEMLEHLQDQISAVLTPAQRDRFGDLIQRWRDAFQKYNADQQQRQAEQRLLEQRRQKQMQQMAPAGSPSPPPAAAPAPAAATPPASPPPAAPAPTG
jgi:uncharacterized membrane-anchored protein YhcB (DUF1043 family)